MFSVWLQGQMSDLVILKKNPHLIADFVANPKIVPHAFSEIRVKYWAKQFFTVKEEFKREFTNQLTSDEIQSIEKIYILRNMIAHAHVSIGRNYMLYRPQGGHQKEATLIKVLKPRKVDDKADPPTFKLEFWKSDIFQSISNLIVHFDQVCLERLSKSLGVPHGRIR